MVPICTSSGGYFGVPVWGHKSGRYFWEPLGTQVRVDFGVALGTQVGPLLLGTFGDTSSGRYCGVPLGTRRVATFGSLWGHKFGPILWGTFGDTSQAANFGNLWGHKFRPLLRGPLGTQVGVILLGTLHANQ